MHFYFYFIKILPLLIADKSLKLLFVLGIYDKTRLVNVMSFAETVRQTTCWTTT